MRRRRRRVGPYPWKHDK